MQPKNTKIAVKVKNHQFPVNSSVHYDTHSKMFMSSHNYFWPVAFYLRTCCEQVLFVRLAVRLSAQKSQKLLVGNWCNYVLWWTPEVVGSWWHLTFDLDRKLFFSFHCCNTIHISSIINSFECLNLATSFSRWSYIFRISRSPSSFKVIGLISRSREQKSGSEQTDRETVNTKNNSPTPAMSQTILAWVSTGFRYILPITSND